MEEVLSELDFRDFDFRDFVCVWVTGACVYVCVCACPPDRLLAERISQAASSRINYQLVDFGFRLSDIWKSFSSEYMGKIKKKRQHDCWPDVPCDKSWGSSPLSLLAELALPHVVDSAQAELVGASRDQTVDRHRC